MLAWAAEGSLLIQHQQEEIPMNSRSTRVLLGMFVLSGVLVSVGRAEPRQTMSLDGVWNFATDPDNRGEAEKWYQPGAKLPDMPLPGYAPAANGKIRVPGIWDNQGYGTETDKVHHSFVGKGWYKRQVEIPQAWAGRRVFLVITGVSRYAKVWIDDQFLGEHIGYLSAFEYDVTQIRRAGPDGDDHHPGRFQAAVGSRRHVRLLVAGRLHGRGLGRNLGARGARSAIRRLAERSVRAARRAQFQLARPAPRSTARPIWPTRQSSKCSTRAASGWRKRRLKPDAKIAAGQPVSCQGAAARCEAVDARQSDALHGPAQSAQRRRSARRGRKPFRHAAIHHRRLPHLLLNGKRLMLRGYGDDHIYPEQMAMPSDKELHLKRLRTIKSYGFNHVRHHSTIMPPEYYDACDEVGIITTAEFPICYDRVHARVGRQVERARAAGHGSRPRPWKPTGASGRPPSSGTATILRSSAGSWATNCGGCGTGDAAGRCGAISNASPASSIPARFFLDADGQ